MTLSVTGVTLVKPGREILSRLVGFACCFVSGEGRKSKHRNMDT